MKSLLAPLLGLFVLAQASTLVAQDHTPVSPGPEIEGLLEALANNDRDGSIGKIKGIFALADDHNDRFVRTPAAFVDLVIGCPVTQTEARVSDFFSLYTYRWECPSGVYQAELGKDPDSSYVEVVDPADEARLALRASQPMVMPMAPPPIKTAADLRAEQEERGRQELVALRLLEPQLRAGTLNAGSLASRSNFTTGYRDLAQSTFIAEMDNDGLEGGNAQLAWLKDTLGKPASVECKQTRDEIGPTKFLTFFSSCTVKTERPGHAYTAFVFFRDAKISSIQFNYMNRKVFELNKEYIMSRGRQN